MLASVSLFAATEPKRVLVVHSFGSVAPLFMTFATAFEAELAKHWETVEECVRILARARVESTTNVKGAVRLRFQRQLHTPNRR
jgi:hypothetical protein